MTKCIIDNLEGMIKDLERYIPIGKANAIHQEKLADMLGVTPAAAKIMVRKARGQGIKICSGKQGYWIAENDNDCQEFVNRMKRQGLSRLQSVSPLKQTLNDYDGQLCFEDIGIYCSGNLEGVTADDLEDGTDLIKGY